MIGVIVGLNVALEEKASHFQTLLAVPNRHKNMLAKLTYLYGSGVFALFFLFLLFVIGMGDKSRTSNMHFGMGLYITNSIIKQHGGQLVLSNSKKTGGAQVTIKIPY